MVAFLEWLRHFVELAWAVGQALSEVMLVVLGVLSMVGFFVLACREVAKQLAGTATSNSPAPPLEGGSARVRPVELTRSTNLDLNRELRTSDWSHRPSKSVDSQ